MMVSHWKLISYDLWLRFRRLFMDEWKEPSFGGGVFFDSLTGPCWPCWPIGGVINPVLSLYSKHLKTTTGLEVNWPSRLITLLPGVVWPRVSSHPTPQRCCQRQRSEDGSSSHLEDWTMQTSRNPWFLQKTSENYHSSPRQLYIPNVSLACGVDTSRKACSVPKSFPQIHMVSIPIYCTAPFWGTLLCHQPHIASWKISHFETSIYNGCPIAKFDYRRIYPISDEPWRTQHGLHTVHHVAHLHHGCGILRLTCPDGGHGFTIYETNGDCP